MHKQKQMNNNNNNNNNKPDEFRDFVLTAKPHVIHHM
jgi:hypothetical protein